MMRLFLAATLLFFFASLDLRVQSQTPREDGQILVPEQVSQSNTPSADSAPTAEPATDATLMSLVVGADIDNEPAPAPAPVAVSMNDICTKLAEAAQDADIPVPFLARLI